MTTTLSPAPNHGNAFLPVRSSIWAKVILGLVLVVMLGNAHVRAEITNLVAIADTALREANPTNNLGGMTFVPVGTTSQGKKTHALFRFNVTGAVPSNAVITSAALNLIITYGAGPLDYNLHRMLRDWGEGGLTGGPGGGVLGAPATNGCATWNSRFHPTNNWAQPGAQPGQDYTHTVSATVTLGSGDSTNIFVSSEIIADVQRWLANPQENFGWILIQANESLIGQARRIASRESGSLAPVLTIEYGSSLPSPPSISNVSRVGNQIRFSFNAEAGQTYAVEFRDTVNAGTWSVLTNISAQPSAAVIDVSDVTSGSKRFYRVRSP